jgi:RHS repeat-associated protein
MRLETTRDSDSAVLQDLRYTYDPIGNILAIEDAAQQTVFFDNAVVTPSTLYEYDPLYRLTEATGREHAGGLGDDQRDENDIPLNNLPHANDTQALRNYMESYAYDKVGNILQMIHDAGGPVGSWTRGYRVADTSNRLEATSLLGDDLEDPESYSAECTHDAHGNVVAMPHLAEIGWDFKDQMVYADKGGGGEVYFTYDAAGQRVRKVWEHAGLIEERIYLGGWEIYRRRIASSGVLELELERETLHLMDGERRVAMVETKTVDTSDPNLVVTPRFRYQLGNHLGSALLEVDETGSVISYEEYHPYGTTAYRSGRSGVEVSAKRYRYTGKERDEETGLYYHGARYYACWLGRWTAADPAGMVDGANLYAYVRGSPVGLVDPSGRESTLTVPEVKIYIQRPPASAYEERAAAGQSEGIDQIARLVGDKAQVAPSGNDTSTPSAQPESTQPQSPPRSESVSGQPSPFTPEERHLQTATIGVGESVGTGGSAAVVGQMLQNWLHGVSPTAADAAALARTFANSGVTALTRRAADGAPRPMGARAVKGEPHVTGAAKAGAAEMGAVKAVPNDITSTAAAGAGATEANVVYRSVSAAGQIQDVGVTNNLARRAAEHLASRGIQVEKVLGGLARSDARAVEQALIEIHGLGKNGGTLFNRINSIAPSNSAYAQQVQRGYELLQSIGYK